MLDFLFRKTTSAYTSAVVVAAGQASRMKGIDKQLAQLDDLPVLVHTLRAFDQCRQIDEVVLVCREEQLGEYLAMTEEYQLEKVSRIVRGGQSRQQSVFAGIAQCSQQAQYFCIHDGARPLVSQQVILDALAAAREHGAATAAVKSKDTIKVVGEDGTIQYTPDRERLYCTQTPQVFEAGLYRRAMEAALAQGKEYTDDCQLVEAIGQKVWISPGEYRNLKITTPEDLAIALALLEADEEGL